ncbi:chaperone modulator CbpM [Amycolatopsis sp. RTGN1]|uniref:chaperone modulator CbpM n=1 Tax=Amycolatopsis ponsaeliensis TaxID=2992142 RepID=UPI00254B106C|nr:chaperone modulator CbpM [Amycolatopsis sp. RTGN1]
MTYALVRRHTGAAHLDLTSFARATGLHPELVQRLLTLGLVDAVQDTAGELWFPVGQLATVGRIQRLRHGFSLNYAAAGLVADLLDHIADLEAALRTRSRRSGG